MSKELIKEKINLCPVCGERSHPLLSSGINIEVPYFKDGILIEWKYYHAGCIQSLEEKKEELKEFGKSVKSLLEEVEEKTSDLNLVNPIIQHIDWIDELLKQSK